MAAFNQTGSAGRSSVVRMVERLESRALLSAAPGSESVPADAPADRNAAAAAAAPLVIGQTINGEISTAGETDEYTFTTAAGQRIYLDVQAVTGTYATLYLDFMLYRLPAGAAPVRVFWTTAYAGEPDIADRDVTALEAGDYKLTVDARLDDLATYQFKILEVPPPDVRQIAIGDEAAGAIEGPGNTDEYLFTAAPGQRIFLDVLETTGDRVALYLDFTLVPVPQSDPPTQVFKSTAYANVPNNGDVGPVTLAGGQYRLIVDARGQQTSTYRFKLVNVPPVDTRSITFGAVSNGAIESAGAIDEWTFSVPAGERMSLDVQEVTGNWTTLSLDFQLLKVAGTTTTEKFKTTAYANEPDRADAGPVVLEAGDYKLVVSARGMDTATYRFVLRRDMNLTASGSSWRAPFVQALRDAGLGDGGFRSDSLEVKPLPWNTINRLTTQLPTGLSLQPADVVARGTYASYTPVELSYDPASGAATWRFAAPLPYDNYRIDVAQSHRARLRLLPGDASRDGRANSLDLAFIKQRLNRSVQSPGTGPGAYSVFADITGDARINALDLAAVKVNLNRTVPTALTPVASAPASPGNALLIDGDRRVLDEHAA